MKNKILLLFLANIFSVIMVAQEKNEQLNKVIKVEELILTKKLDSALLVLKGLETSARVERLIKIASKETLSYSDYFTFVAQTGNKPGRDYSLVSNFINENISEPSSKKINLDLEWNASVPKENISVKVCDGHVFLSGIVKWAYQKSEAEKSLQYIDGIKSITNTISINTKKETPINILQNINKANVGTPLTL